MARPKQPLVGPVHWSSESATHRDRDRVAVGGTAVTATVTIYVVKKDEGGRHTPFFNGYTPQFFFRTTDVTGTANVLGDADMAMPSEGVKLRVSLGRPFRRP